MARLLATSLSLDSLSGMDPARRPPVVRSPALAAPYCRAVGGAEYSAGHSALPSRGRCRVPARDRRRPWMAGVEPVRDDCCLACPEWHTAPPAACYGVPVPGPFRCATDGVSSAEPETRTTTSVHPSETRFGAIRGPLARDIPVARQSLRDGPCPPSSGGAKSSAGRSALPSRGRCRVPARDRRRPWMAGVEPVMEGLPLFVGTTAVWHVPSGTRRRPRRATECLSQGPSAVPPMGFQAQSLKPGRRPASIPPRHASRPSVARLLATSLSLDSLSGMDPARRPPVVQSPALDTL